MSCIQCCIQTLYNVVYRPYIMLYTHRIQQECFSLIHINMKLLSKYIFSALFLAASGGSATAQSMRANTYCNPLNVDYTYMIYNSSNNLSYRSGADPAVVEFRGEYYMFVTRSHGYWHSKDLLNWDFITPGKNWYPQGSNAPAAHNYKDSVQIPTA